MFVHLLVLIVGLIGVAVQAPAAKGNDAENTTAKGVSDQVNSILTEVEKANAKIRDVQCRIKLVEDDQINLTKRIKTGSIKFMLTGDNPRFMIHFEKSEVDGMLQKQEWFLFDGRWLYQGIERLKQVTKQEYVRPGETVNFFDLDSAPFPLPFGQKKDEILRNFNVTYSASSASNPANTDHLICIPKSTSRFHRRYDKLELFVLRDLRMPIRIIATGKEGYEITTADFPDLSNKTINNGFSEKDFIKPKAWRKYEEVVERLGPAGP